MIKHLVFDFGGVILNLNGIHSGYPDDLSVILNMPIKETTKIWNENKHCLVTGKETPKEFLIRMKSMFHLSFDVEKSIHLWEKRNAISEERIDWGLIHMIEKLHKKYHVHMLTDQINLDNGAHEWIHTINNHFDTILRSYEQGYRKPSPESYKNLLEKIDAVEEPSSVIFIDDTAENILVAEKAGINGILYTFGEHEKLQSELIAQGIQIQIHEFNIK